MKKFIIVFVFCFLIIFPLQAVISDSVNAGIEEDLIDVLKQELTLVRNEVSGLRDEVLEIKKMLTALTSQKPPEVVSVNIGKDPFMGDKDAAVTVIEFSDYECPSCGSFARSIFPILKKDYIDTGKVKYIHRDFPLDIHEDAPKAAEAVRCALEQGKYWEMHDMLFANQENLDIESLKGYAEKLGMDMDSFNSCLDSGKYSEAVKENLNNEELARNVSGTPSFILGIPTPEGILRGPIMKGSPPINVFKQIIESFLQN